MKTVNIRVSKEDAVRLCTKKLTDLKAELENLPKSVEKYKKDLAAWEKLALDKLKKNIPSHIASLKISPTSNNWDAEEVSFNLGYIRLETKGLPPRPFHPFAETYRYSNLDSALSSSTNEMRRKIELLEKNLKLLALATDKTVSASAYNIADCI